MVRIHLPPAKSRANFGTVTLVLDAAPGNKFLIVFPAKQIQLTGCDKLTVPSVARRLGSEDPLLAYGAAPL